jgi:DNA-binding CsgD family transcriptional regulator
MVMRSGREGLPHTARLEGRSVELGVLFDVLAGATVPRALVLTGEAGVGKTALLDAVRTEAARSGTLVLHAAGVEVEAKTSFSALNQALLPLTDDLSVLGEDHRSALSVALGIAAGTAPDSMVVSNAVLRLLVLRSATRPCLLIIDDLQWVDRASAGVLSFVARRLNVGDVAFLGAARPEGQNPFDATNVPELTVPPLDEDAALQLLARRFPALAPSVRQRLIAEAEGNPLALLELPMALSESQRTARTPMPQVLPVSRRLQTSFAARVERLPRESRQLLLTAALVEAGELKVLNAVGGDTFVADLHACEEAQLLFVDAARQEVRFRHPIIRAAVVEQATFAECLHAHAQLAQAFSSDPDRNIWHLAAATVEPDEPVARRLEDAAHDMVGRGDPHNALSALIRSADLSPEPADRARRLSEAAYLGASGQLRDVADLLDDARQSAPSIAESLPFAAAAAFAMLNGSADVRTAHDLLVVAFDSARGDVPREALEPAVNVFAYVCYLGGDADLWASFHRVLAPLLPDAPDEWYLKDRLFADPLRADPKAMQLLDAAIESLRDQYDQQRVVALSGDASSVDRLARCREALWRVVRDGREGNVPIHAQNALAMLALDDFQTGLWDEVEEHCHEGLRLGEGLGFTLDEHVFRFHLGMVAAARGDHERASSLANENARWGAPRGVLLAQTSAHYVHTLRALGQGDFEEAYRHASAISPAGTLATYVPHTLRAALDLVESALRSGRDADALAHVEAMRSARVARISPRMELLFLAASALVASPADASSVFEAALAVPDASRWPFEYARVQLLYGEHLRRSRAAKEARVYLVEAEETFRRLRAEPWVKRSAHEVRASGIARSQLLGGSGEALTPQEYEIAMLAASGFTNKEIAQKLYMSHRTVSSHLYRIFPKLGITSRAALGDALKTRPPE